MVGLRGKDILALDAGQSFHGSAVISDDNPLGYINSFDWPVSVAGTAFLQLFNGESSISIAMSMVPVPVCRPWGLASDSRMDVTKNVPLLCDLIDKRRVTELHMAVPCQSYTLARDPPLRSATWLTGLPDLGIRQERLVSLATHWEVPSLHWQSMHTTEVLCGRWRTPFLHTQHK